MAGTKQGSSTKTAKIKDNCAEETERFDYDGFWKDLIKRFFYLLLKKTLPELYEDADRETEPRTLDKEFTDILNTSDPAIHNSPYFADLVMEVPLKNGGAEWIMLHCEAQGSGGANFAERMNHYKCLIYGHYRREPVALAIITDKRPVNEPLYYSHKRYGTESVYKYNNLILSELDDDELIMSDNPIDLALYAAKCASRSRTAERRVAEHKEELRKYRYLRKLIELLGERGWSRNDKRDLLLFIERILHLKDEGLKTQYVEYRQQLNEEGKIVYIRMGEEKEVAEIERRGMEKGMEKGIEKGKLEFARNLLANGVPLDLIAKSSGLPTEKIQALAN
ncbi:hypothetical protein FACS1894167_15450 [Synergistales bacterium]|nr:hypothetical protein FACS1894167_15450 [Synergistales bacterium]